MLRYLSLALLAALPLSAIAAEPAELEPVYVPGSQYTAALSTRMQQWTMSALDGSELQIRNSSLCGSGATPPKGLWVISRDEQGHPELVAPSATLLPEGHSGRIVLRDCDDPQLLDAQEPAYGVPAPVLELLTATAGAVLVDD